MQNTFEHPILAQIYSPKLLVSIVNKVAVVSATKARDCEIEFLTWQSALIQMKVIHSYYWEEKYSFMRTWFEIGQNTYGDREKMIYT